MKNLFLMLIMVVATTLTSFGAYEVYKSVDTDSSPWSYYDTHQYESRYVNAYATASTTAVADAYSKIRIWDNYGFSQTLEAEIYMDEDFVQDGENGIGYPGSKRTIFATITLRVSREHPHPYINCPNRGRAYAWVNW